MVARNELEAIGLRLVTAYNERDFEGGLALAHPDIVGMPSRANRSADGFRGRDGLREWMATVAGREPWLEVVVTSMHTVERLGTGAGTLAMFGNMCLDGEPLGPWATVLIIQDGLVIRQRSYHSTREMLEELGVVDDAFDPPPPAA